MPTTYMGMTIPQVLVTAGPTYATQINAAFDLVDAHDHSPGKGVQVPAAGLNIDGDVSWGGYSITSLKASIFAQQSSVATANSLYFKSDDNLWCTNGSGTPVQITSGGTLNSGALINSVWTPITVDADITINASDPYTLYQFNTSTFQRHATLPLAADVSPGRYYVFKDFIGNSYNVPCGCIASGSDTIDGASDYSIDANYGWVILASDGVSEWHVISNSVATETSPGVVQLAGDLAGAGVAPSVTGITGSGGMAVIRNGCSILEFAAGNTPEVSIRQAASSGDGSNLLIQAQAAGGSNKDGGHILLTPGSATGSGDIGSTFVQNGVGNIGVMAGAFSVSRNYTALHTAPGSASIPEGDFVLFIANCNTAPTTPGGTPVGGGVLYVDSGALKYIGSSGTITPVAPA